MEDKNIEIIVDKELKKAEQGDTDAQFNIAPRYEKAGGLNKILINL